MDCLMFDSEIDYVSYILSSGNSDNLVVLSTSEMQKQLNIVGEQYEKEMRSIIEAIL